MKYLVDANVLSEVTKSNPSPLVVQWLAENQSMAATNPIVLGEVELGILILPASKKREQLMNWFVHGLAAIPVLRMDANTSHIWASLVADLRRKGRAMSVKDSLIAASAIQSNLIVATRNVRDFQYCGVEVVNPFASSS